MRIATSVAIFTFIALIMAAGAAYAGGGGPHLWLSTDPNQFNEGGLGYINDGSAWQNDSYVATSMPFTAYLYNASPGNKGTAYDIGLIVAVQTGDEEGSITIADAFGVEQTLTYADFKSFNPYPGGGHGIDGMYAVLKPSQTINLTTDNTNYANTSSKASSWTQFVVKSSSFAEYHLDARSFGGSDVFYNPASHDINFGGGGGDPSVPEPASMVLVGIGLAGLLARRKKSIRP